jgi:hypothetical protein
MITSIITAVIALISGAAQAVSGWFGYASTKLTIENEQAMQDMARRQDEVKATDRSERAVADKDANEIRKEIAE